MAKNDINLAEKTLSESEDITGSFLNFAKGNCDSSSARPCYDKQTGKKVIGLEPKGGEKAFAACLKNAAPNDYGTLTIKTSKCDAEQLNYCYDGRSRTMLRNFEGQCITPEPIPNRDCPSVPFLEFVSGVEEGWDSPTNYLGLRTIIQSKSGALYVGGFKYETNSYDSYGQPYYKWAGKVYKSVDNGKNWVGVTLPNDYWYGFVRRIIEDSNGVLYAAGSLLWKSTDGGNTWLIISQSIADITAGASVQDVLQSKDGSLIALVYKTQPDYSNEVYKSYDGGKTWQLILKPNFQYFNTYINSYLAAHSYNFIEADDGSLIFSTTGMGGDIYTYSNNVLTKTMSTGIDAGSLHFLKVGDGTIYFIAANPEKPNGALVSYQSSDNGKTWIKTGELPYSKSVGWEDPIESSDGSIWAIAHTDCWQSIIYKSNDKGVTWSPAAIAPLSIFWQFNSYGRIQGPPIMDIAEGGGGKIYSVPNQFGAVFVVP